MADNHHTSTPFSRRGLLAGLGTATAIAAGTGVNLAAIAATRPAIAPISPAIDPIVDLIEAHRRAWAEWETWFDRQGDLEDKIPAGARAKSPEWIECQAGLAATWDHFYECGRVLLGATPRTSAGLVAVLDYFAAAAVRCDGDFHATIDEDDEEGAQLHWSVLALKLVRRSMAVIAGAGTASIVSTEGSLPGPGTPPVRRPGEMQIISLAPPAAPGGLRRGMATGRRGRRYEFFVTADGEVQSAYVEHPESSIDDGRTYWHATRVHPALARAARRAVGSAISAA